MPEINTNSRCISAADDKTDQRNYVIHAQVVLWDSAAEFERFELSLLKKLKDADSFLLPVLSHSSEHHCAVFHRSSRVCWLFSLTLVMESTT